jgi:beta-phosphoglucomutase
MERSRIFKRIFKPRIFSGAKSLLGFFDRKDIKLGLVTATPRREVARMLPLPMLRLFDATICGGDTKKGKPHPEPYLKALKALKVKAKEAIVIENAPYGIRSCKLAGICCIAVATSLPKRYLRGADVVLNSLHDVNDYFKKRGHKRDE